MKRYIVTLLTGVLLVAPAVTADAQEYLFRVPEVQMLVTVKPDASVRIAYDFTFQNTPGGHTIDIVDIGVPHSGYSLNNVRAWSGNRPLSDIRVSTVVKPGFEVHMGAATIPRGGTGRLRVEFTMPNMVYQDTTRSDYASLRITPTWFGDQYVVGKTHLQIAIQLPKGVEPDEALHQGLSFTKKATTSAGPLVGWDFPAVRFTGPHMVAVSFPKRDLQKVVHITKLGLLLRWFESSKQARYLLGGVYLLLLAFLFFRFSGGTGLSVFAVLAIGSCIVFVFNPVLHLLAMPIVVMLIAINEWFLDHRKTHYMPPIAQVEGGGIKRGLTAPEAAMLLELPVAKVLCLVVFGMLKRGILRQAQADPLTVEVDKDFQWKSDQPVADQPRQEAFLREASVKRGIMVHNYELPFLFLLQKNPGKPVHELNFSLPMKKLIENTATRMKGFDLSDTQAYYRTIVRRATEQAAAIGDIPQRERAIDRNFEWILLDNDYPTVFRRGPYQPVWSRGPVVLTSGSAPVSGPSPAGATTFGDVAASFSGWAENTFGSMASAISPGSLNLSSPSGGFLDLSGADHVAGEFFKALGEAGASGGHGGGGGCACAGCACACACAGGGR